MQRKNMATDAFHPYNPHPNRCYLRKLKLTTFLPPPLVPLYLQVSVQTKRVSLIMQHTWTRLDQRRLQRSRAQPRTRARMMTWFAVCSGKLKFPIHVNSRVRARALKDLLVSPQIVAPWILRSHWHWRVLCPSNRSDTFAHRCIICVLLQSTCSTINSTVIAAASSSSTYSTPLGIIVLPHSLTRKSFYVSMDMSYSIPKWHLHDGKAVLTPPMVVVVVVVVLVVDKQEWRSEWKCCASDWLKNTLSERNWLKLIELQHITSH